MAYDVLNMCATNVEYDNVSFLSQNNNSNNNSQQRESVDIGVTRIRSPIVPPCKSLNSKDESFSNISRKMSQTTLVGEANENVVCLLKFQVSNFFMLGSPVGLILTFRYQNLLNSFWSSHSLSNNSPTKCANSHDGGDSGLNFKLAARNVFNLFHSVDPYGFRIEPLLDPRFGEIAPMTIPPYNRFPLGDGQSINLIQTMLEQVKVFDSLQEDRGEDQIPKQNCFPSTKPTKQRNLICGSTKTHNCDVDGDDVQYRKLDDATIESKNAFNQASWEKKTVVVLEAFKSVCPSWWGEKRIDYIVQCPEAVQHLLPRLRPAILYTSFWESTDVVAFILRQSLESMGLHASSSANCFDADDDVTFSASGRSPSMSLDQIISSPVNHSPSNIESKKWFSLWTPSLVNSGRRSLFKRTQSDRFKYGVGKHSIKPLTQVKMYPYKMVVRNFKPNHRANDVIVLSGQPVTIRARFTMGSLDLINCSNKNIQVDVQHLNGLWEHVGTAITDSSGRISYRLPDQVHLTDGFYPIRLTLESDLAHSVYLTLAIVPPATEVVMFSVDGSFAASLSVLGKDPKVQPGCVDVARHWQGLGYLLIYLSARPDMQVRGIVNWMSKHNFPHGLTFFLDGFYTDPMRQKAQLVQNMINSSRLRVHCAYGSNKDLGLYKLLGLNSNQIFVVGKMSRSQSSYGTALTSGYASHLANLIEGDSLSCVASGTMSSKIRCFSHSLPIFNPPSLSANKSSNKKTAQNHHDMTRLSNNPNSLSTRNTTL